MLSLFSKILLIFHSFFCSNYIPVLSIVRVSCIVSNCPLYFRNDVFYLCRVKLSSMVVTNSMTHSI